MNRQKWLLLLGLALVFVLGFAPGRPAYAVEGTPEISGAPIVIEVGGSFDPLEGITLTDDKDSEAELMLNLDFYDGSDVSVAGVYEIYYYVRDSDGNEEDLIRPVFVLGPEAPLIYAGYANVIMDQPFDPMENVFAYDLTNGDLTSAIVEIYNDVDISTPGEYTITFQVTDLDGNVADAIKYVYVNWPPEYYPVITAETLFIVLCEPYDLMDGVTATDASDGDLTDQIILQHSEVEPDVPGIYWTEYYVMNSKGLEAYASRPVIVLDLTTSPVIITRDFWMETGWTWDPLSDVYAYDTEDRDISDQVEIFETDLDLSQAGDYFVTYVVTDSDGNTAYGTSAVTVEWSYENYPTIHVPSRTVYLPLNAAFDPLAGVTATDAKDGDLTAFIQVDSYLDTSVAGEYHIEYSVTNSMDLTGWEQVLVYVLDTSEPQLVAYDFTIELNQEPNLDWIHFEAYDLEDGDLRDAVTGDFSAVDHTTAGTYPVYLQVTDSDGNTAEATCYATVVDYSYPQLDVWDHAVLIDSEYDPLDYANAWDDQDGDLTDSIEIIKNTVRIHKLGIYYVTYSVTDSDGTTAAETVEVEVIKEPVYTYYLNFDGNMIQLETDDLEEVIMLTSPVYIPTDTEVSVAIFIDGDLYFDIPGFIIGGEIQPDLTYVLEITEEGILMPVIMPHLYQGIGIRTSAISGEVQFKSTTGGTLYYDVSDVGSELPDIDTSGEGLPGNSGVNILKLQDLPPAKAQIVRIVMVDPEYDPSNMLTIEVPRTPANMNPGEKPDKPVKPEQPVKPEKPEKPQKPEKPATPDKPDKANDDPGKPDSPKSTEEGSPKSKPEQPKENIKNQPVLDKNPARPNEMNPDQVKDQDKDLIKDQDKGQDKDLIKDQNKDQDKDQDKDPINDQDKDQDKDPINNQDKDQVKDQIKDPLCP